MISQDPIFLPVWRDEDVIMFSSHQGPDGRLEWLSVARSPLETSSTSFVSLGRLPLSKSKLEDFNDITCRVRDDYSQYTSLLNVNHLAQLTKSSTSLLELCGYFSFLRKYAVDGWQIEQYLNSDPEKRFTPALGLAINRLVFDRFDFGAADRILEADALVAEGTQGTQDEHAEYHRSVARLYEMTGNFVCAADSIRKSNIFRRTADKQRKLGDYLFSANEMEEAATAFLDAEKLAPLPVPSAFRLGKVLYELGRFDEALAYLNTASSDFPAPSERMISDIHQKISAHQDAK